MWWDVSNHNKELYDSDLLQFLDDYSVTSDMKIKLQDIKKKVPISKISKIRFSK